MKIEQLTLNGLKLIRLSPFVDHRGFWMRTFDEKLFIDHDISVNWVQENHSKSVRKGTVRGLHFIKRPYTDAKLIRCIKGKILDVVVDLRLNSPSFGDYAIVELDEDDHSCLFIPKGFAHGFCTLTDDCEMIYKHDEFYSADNDSGVLWNDTNLRIPWPLESPIISEKDSKLMTYNEFIRDIGGL